MQTTIFTDGLGNIRMVDVVLRFELINIRSQPEPNKLDVESVGSVAMTLQGLVRTYNQLSGVMNQLTEQGVLKRSDPSAAPAQQAPAAQIAAQPSAAAEPAAQTGTRNTLKKMAK